MLRIGMTNPPYILEHLKEIAEVLRHPCVYSFLHVPVQSGSDAILSVSTRLLLFLFVPSAEPTMYCPVTFYHYCSLSQPLCPLNSVHREKLWGKLLL